MKRLEPFALDQGALARELTAFERLLKPAKKELSERADVLPFFKTNLNLASLLGFYNSHLVAPDVIKSEFELFGDHSCDLLIGERQNGRGQFCFVEFEDARPNSVFQRSRKGTPDWAPRLEHGFSQIVDWSRTLAGQTYSAQFKEFFGTDLANYCGLLVIGRDAFLTDADSERLRWRSQNVLVAGRAVSIVTFDQLLHDLRSRGRFVSSLGTMKRTGSKATKPRAKKQP